MKELFYKFLVMLSKKWGDWIFIIFARIVATGFFLFFPSRVVNSFQFYSVLFPERSRWYHLRCAWKQYHNFTYVFLDRFLLQEFGDISYACEGWEYLEEALKNKTGGILLMSHLGNWEVAAHLLKRKQAEMKLLLYMGRKYKEQIERIQKDSLSQSGIKIIAVDQEGGSPFDIIEGINFLKTGGLVSLTGDRTGKQDQRVIPVQFMGHEVWLPEIPHLFALLSGAPLFIFFTFRTGKKQYHFTTSQPIYVKTASCSMRKEAIRKSAQHYADILEETLRLHPLEWYHFEHFLGRKKTVAGRGLQPRP